MIQNMQAGIALDHTSNIGTHCLRGYPAASIRLQLWGPISKPWRKAKTRRPWKLPLSPVRSLIAQ